MSEARRRWTLPEFLDWEERQDRKYELVDGEPRMMTGVSQGHSTIVINIVLALRERLRRLPCRPHGPELRLITGNQNVRYPDAVIDCGTYRPESHEISEPVVVFEVLSKSTAWTDLHRKLRDYEATPAIRHYVVIAQDEPRVELWSRADAQHFVRAGTFTSLSDQIALQPPGMALPLSDIYESLGFESQVPTD